MLIHCGEVSFSEQKIKDKRLIMKHLIGTQKVFGDLGDQVIYDGTSFPPLRLFSRPALTQSLQGTASSTCPERFNPG